VAITTTILYTVGAISVAARIFGGDAILYGATGSWTEFWRRPDQLRTQPSLNSAALTVAVLFPLYFVAGGIMGQFPQMAMGERLTWLAINTILLFLVLPLMIAAWQRVELPSGLSVRKAPWLAFAGAIVLGLSLWPLAYELVLFGRKLGIDPINIELVDRVEKLLAEWRALSPILIIAALALTPAICEELFFRGFLLNALRGRAPASAAIFISAFLFGLFHTFVGSTLTLERFLPTTFLGIFMAYVCWQSGSVLPGMALHALNNSIVLMMAYYRDELTAQVFGASQAERLPAPWLIGALIASIVGVALVYLGRSPTSEPPKSSPERLPESVDAGQIAIRG
jgi:ABC-2 type transport system permease protein/sodium transport system permease protein